MKEDIRLLLLKIIEDSLKDVGLDKASEGYLRLDLSQDSRYGDLSTNIALRLSKSARKSPQEVAKILADGINKRLENSPIKDHLKEIKAEGAGFINFYLSNKYFCAHLRDIILKGRGFIKTNIGKDRRVLIEFVSANPTGPLSVAHARQAVAGDVLANILGCLGFRVKREYYLNDEGNQINTLGKSIELRLKELSGEKIEFPEDYYQGEYICDVAREIRGRGLKVKDFSQFGVAHILSIIKKELDDFGVKFDYWYSQKKLRKSGRINKALDFLKSKGLVYEDGGATWFKSTLLGDDKDRVVVKSDGSYTYLAPDIAYHQDKFRRGFEWLINLWGPDHHGYIGRLKAAVSAFGKKPESLSIIIVQLASIFREGKPVQMSTRRGQYITLREVLDEVGLDASRFFFLMRRTASHLDFDLDIAKKHTSENPVYYVQYAHARIYSILQNSPIKTGFKNIDLTVLKENEEIELIKKIWQFPFILNICFVTLDPYMLTVYLQALAEDFHKFYDKHRVLGQDDNLTRARLALIEGARLAISSGLDLIGVSRPEKM
ncbi:MAG: arginine--tRNA ligase [Candidatus Omnitrophota bacterium]